MALKHIIFVTILVDVGSFSNGVVSPIHPLFLKN